MENLQEIFGEPAELPVTPPAPPAATMIIEETVEGWSERIERRGDRLWSIIQRDGEEVFPWID